MLKVSTSYYFNTIIDTDNRYDTNILKQISLTKIWINPEMTCVKFTIIRKSGPTLCYHLSIVTCYCIN